jgi:hypothetical protein
MLGSLPLLLRVGVWGQELPVRVWKQGLALPELQLLPVPLSVARRE